MFQRQQESHTLARKYKAKKMSPNSGVPPNHAPNRRIIVSIISHNHEKHISEILQPHLWKTNSSAIIPVILSNVPSVELRHYCNKFGLSYIENKKQNGFGTNNNKVFYYADQKYQLSANDFFFTINPDIRTSEQSIEAIAEIMELTNIQIAAPNLKNAKGYQEDNIRSFPTLVDCILRFIFRSNRSRVEKEKINQIERVDWAAGAYLAFQADTFKKIKGFDEQYFMYYEDADICRRARKTNIGTYYLPMIDAIHIAARNSRSPFSRHLLWHIKSAIRFFLTR